MIKLSEIKYSDILELIIFILLLIMFSSWLNDQYVCSLEYDYFDIETENLLNLSTNNTVYYSKDDVLNILQMNKDLINYNINMSCNFKFFNKH